MRILFCNIAWMNYYKGITDKDIPKGGGSFVDEMHDGNEIYNFLGERICFDDGFTTVVGWYQNATVFRHYQNIELTLEDGSIYIQTCNAIAKKEDCVLLPRLERSQILKWKVPRKKNGISYGFGRANVWFASEQHANDNLDKYLKDLTDRITDYSGENWVDKVE